MKLPTARPPLSGFACSAGRAWLATVLLAGSTALAQERESSPRTGVQTIAAAATTGVGQSSDAAARVPTSDAAKAEITETEIVARDGADFDGKGRVAIFNGNVHIQDPRFELWCDRLTVFLNREAKEDADAAQDKPPPSNNPQASSGGGIDRAVAEGHVVIKQTKPATDGGEAKTSIGRSERAEYTNRTGEIVLSGGRPSIEQGMNILEATSSQTRIILNRDNTLRTEGPSRTIIRQRGDANDKLIPGGPSKPAATPPAAGAGTPKPRTPGRTPNR